MTHDFVGFIKSVTIQHETLEVGEKGVLLLGIIFVRHMFASEYSEASEQYFPKSHQPFQVPKMEESSPTEAVLVRLM